MSPLHKYRMILVALLIAAIGVSITGCGTNKFEQELQTEEAAVKLTNETISGQYDLMSTEELKELLDGKPDIVLIDTMPAAASFNKGHIAGAVNFEFPKDVIDAWNGDTMGQRTKADFEQLLGEDKNKPLVFYCGFVKCARSHNGAVFARELGYTNVTRYPGGIHAWRGAGYRLTTD